MKNTIGFLKKLKKNNNTPWMHAHKEEYLVAKKEFEFLVQELIARMSEWDTRLPHLEVKNCTFRINRDVRFTENKDPYKDHFGAYFSYGGKKGGLPGYYLQISPKEILIAGGVWMPESDKLIQIRRHILEDGDLLKKIIEEKKFKKTFNTLNDENKLKRPPKGYPSHSEYLEFLKLKSFTASIILSTDQLPRPGFGKMVDQYFKQIKPLNYFLLEACQK